MKISIIGAGITGLSTAILLKIKGFDVCVYERNSKISDIGAGIVCWPNACFVLEKMGVLSELKKIAYKPKYMKRLSKEGELLGIIPILKLNELMNYPSYSILRKDLMKVLLIQAEKLKINILYNYNLTKLASSSKKSTSLYFENGSCFKSDIVLGADGRMNSTVRTYVCGQNSPVYQGFINWIGTFESKEKIFSKNEISDYWGIGERFGIVPVSETKAYWAGAIYQKKIADNNENLYKFELNKIFRFWPNPIGKIIKDTPLKSIKKIYIHDHDPIQTWHKNNVLLIGDASHAALPTSGQGACQALEDAWHLSQCLKIDSVDIKIVFQNFTLKRLKKTSIINKIGRNIAADLFNDSKVFCKNRNTEAQGINYEALAYSMARTWRSDLY